jgi:membrane protein DedA with SNARE-associated domain
MLAAGITHSITSFVADHSVYAVFALMLVDAVFPAASELVMVYGGALAAGAFGSRHIALFGHPVSSHIGAFLVVALAGTLGYVVGAVIGWAIGAAAGRPFVEAHGRMLHLNRESLERADRWFARRGRFAVFVGRLTPLVRSFVSIPAGVMRMPLASYTFLTLAGSAIWCFGLASVGWAVGRSYARFNHAFDLVTAGLVVVLLLALGTFVLRRRAVKPALGTSDD